LTEIWLVRHGQTDGNVRRIVQGQQDIPLNETGIAQAEALAEQLADVHFDAIYSSDLSRAMQTAGIIARYKGLPVVADPRLREIRQGVWEGLPFDHILQKYQPDFSPNPVYINTPRAEGAESLAEVLSRMVEAANEYSHRHAGKRILFLSHGLSSAALYCFVNGMPLVNVDQHIPQNAQPLVLTIEELLSVPEFTNRQT
jgi:probable phosphoglycerate mutase